MTATVELRRFELPSEGSALIALVADTHSKPHPRVAEHLAAEPPTLILHAGDIGALSVVDALAAIAPTIAVRGNIDAHTPGVPDSVHLELVRGGQVALGIWLTHIAVYGPRLRAEVRRAALAARVQVVVCGHSHVPFLSRDGKLVVFNPGSIGPRRFQLPITYGRMRLADGKVTLEHVDAESGRVWQPPGA